MAQPEVVGVVCVGVVREKEGTKEGEVVGRTGGVDDEYYSVHYVLLQQHTHVTKLSTLPSLFFLAVQSYSSVCKV